MKIAIPTNDNINIAGSIVNAIYFKVFQIEKGNIVNEEIIKNNNADITIKGNFLAGIIMCDYILANEIHEEIEKYLNTKNIRFALTNETIITNAINKYLNSLIKAESNLCCCP